MNQGGFAKDVVLELRCGGLRRVGVQNLGGGPSSGKDTERPSWLEAEVGSWGAQCPPMPGQAASSHPLCLSQSLGCQVGAGTIRGPLGPGQPVRGWPWAGLSYSHWVALLVS